MFRITVIVFTLGLSLSSVLWAQIVIDDKTRGQSAPELNYSSPALERTSWADIAKYGLIKPAFGTFDAISGLNPLQRAALLLCKVIKFTLVLAFAYLICRIFKGNTRFYELIFNKTTEILTHILTTPVGRRVIGGSLLAFFLAFSLGSENGWNSLIEAVSFFLGLILEFSSFLCSLVLYYLIVRIALSFFVGDSALRHIYQVLPMLLGVGAPLVIWMSYEILDHTLNQVIPEDKIIAFFQIG